MAMEARGYRGGSGRTRMKVLSFTSKDAIAFIIFGLICIWSILVRFAFNSE